METVPCTIITHKEIKKIIQLDTDKTKD